MNMVHLNTLSKLLWVFLLTILFCSPVSSQKQVSIDRVKLAQDKAKADAAKQKAEAAKKKAAELKVASKKQTSPKKIASTKTKTSIVKKKTTSQSVVKRSLSNSSVTTLSVNNNYFDVSAEGSTNTVVVYTNAKWDFYENPAYWVHAIRDGNYINLKIDKNLSSYPRTDSFVIQAGGKKQKVSISQRGNTTSTYLNISKTYVTFSSDGGTETFNISCNGDWQIKMDTYPWGHLSRKGNTLTLRVDANDSRDSRTDFFTVKCGNLEKQVNITQYGKSSNYSSTSSYSSSYNSYNYNNNYYKNESWWKDRVAFGWNITAFDINSENLSWKTGLRLRFGKSTDWFNFIVGCDYSLQKVFIKGGSEFVSYGYSGYQNGYYSDYGYYDGYYKYTDPEWKTVHHEIFIPLEARLNFARCGESSRCYIGAGFDIGLRVGTGDVESNETIYAVDPQFGIMWKNFDFGVDCRIYLNNTTPINDSNTRFGIYGTWYF